MPSWKGVDRLDDTSKCFKQHLVGLWVAEVLFGGLSAITWPLSFTSHQSSGVCPFGAAEPLSHEAYSTALSL